MTRWLALLAFLLLPSLAHAQATVVTSCGSTTLSAGTSHFVTVDTNGQSCQHGGGSAVATSVWSATDAAANGMTLSNGGLTVQGSGAASYDSVRGTISHSSGKYYVEFKMVGGVVSVGGNGDPSFGIADALFSPLDYLGHNPTSAGSFSGATALTIGNPSASFTTSYTLSVFPAVNDVFSLAVDLTAGKYWMAQNNVWFGSGNPATGANSMVTWIAPVIGLSFFPGMTLRFDAARTGIWTLQPTAASQTYAPPTGFSPWN